MKRCSMCKEWKDKSEFGILRSSKDGLQYTCRKCRKVTQDRYKKNNPTKRRESLKKYSESEKGKISEKRYRSSDTRKATLKRWYDGKGKQTHKIYRASNPIKNQARQAVSLAVRSGILPRVNTKKCRDCGVTAQIYHHWSYEQKHWLNVVPVCRQCHANIHKAMAQ